MIKIVFVCHGNICRSVMAEYIFKNYLNKNNLTSDFDVISRAVSSEEVGNDIYYLAAQCLRKHNIPFEQHHAKKITKSEFDTSDYIYVMDSSNLYYLNHMFGSNPSKVKLLLKNRDISDPWYTRDFEKTFNDINEGISMILNDLNL